MLFEVDVVCYGVRVEYTVAAQSWGYDARGGVAERAVSAMDVDVASLFCLLRVVSTESVESGRPLCCSVAMSL